MLIVGTVPFAEFWSPLHGRPRSSTGQSGPRCSPPFCLHFRQCVHRIIHTCQRVVRAAHLSLRALVLEVMQVHLLLPCAVTRLFTPCSMVVVLSSMLLPHLVILLICCFMAFCFFRFCISTPGITSRVVLMPSVWVANLSTAEGAACDKHSPLVEWQRVLLGLTHGHNKKGNLKLPLQRSLFALWWRSCCSACLTRRGPNVQK